MKNKFYLLSLIFSLLTLWSCGTEDYVAVVGNIEGTVRDADTKEPIGGCEVISNSYGTKTTDNNGHFNFENVEPGNVSLTYKANGYESETRDIAVTAGKTVSADANLKPVAVANALYPDKSILDFGNTSAVQNLILKNPTNQSISFSITANADWILVDPAHGAVLPGRESTIKVSVNRDGLSDGSYDRNLTIETATGPIQVQILMEKGSVSRPIVSTLSVSQSVSNPNSVEVKGAIVSIGSAKITRHGFCYAIGADPTVEENAGITNLGDISYPGDFTGVIPNLEFEKNYRIRAYATNSVGTSYGDVLQITLHKQEFASVQTKDATNVSANSGTLNATISGGSVNSFSKIGFFYGTTPECKTQSGNAVGSGSSFSLQLSGLSPDTEYFYKAYGEDSRGIQIGEVKSFRTSKDSSSAGTITVVTSDATNIGVNTATLNGALTSSGNVKIKEYGFYYGTSSNPSLRKTVKTYSSPTTVQSTSFNTNLTGLQENTKYYFQAYALDANNNIVKGSELSLTTKKNPTITVTSIELTRDGTYLILKGEATINPNGASIMEAGIVYSDLDYYVKYSSDGRVPSGGQAQGEIKGNKMTFYDTHSYPFGKYVYYKAYLLLSDGTVIYSSAEPDKVNVTQ